MKGSEKGQAAPEKRGFQSSAVAVTLFEDRAEVVRRAKVVLDSAGDGWVSIEGLSAFVNDRSVRTRVIAGNAELVTARIVRNVEWLGDLEDGEIEALDEQLQKADEDVVRETMAADRSQHKQDRSNKLIEQWVQSLSKVPPCADEETEKRWRGAFESLDEARHQDLRRLVDSRARLEKAQEVLARARVRHEQSRRRHPVCKASVEAQLRSQEPEAVVELELTYLVPCALWRPEHMARLRIDSDDATDGKIEWTTWATVWQVTGETWDDVALKLSTARTTKAAAAPILEDDLLILRTKTALEKKVVTVEARDEDVAVTGVEGERSSVSEMPGVDDGGEPLVLEASRPVSIPSDGEPYRIEIESFELVTTVKRVLIAERSKMAHYKATTTLDNVTPILAGPVRLARNNAVVGSGRVDFVAPSDTFEIGFGPDDGLLVKRQQHESRDRTRLAGKQLIERKVEVFISNLSGTAKTVEITERIPVSEIEAVEISLLESAGWKLEQMHGLLRSAITVPLRGTETLSFKYGIKAKSNVVLPF